MEAASQEVAWAYACQAAESGRKEGLCRNVVTTSDTSDGLWGALEAEGTGCSLHTLSLTCHGKFTLK